MRKNIQSNHFEQVACFPAALTVLKRLWISNAVEVGRCKVLQALQGTISLDQSSGDTDLISLRSSAGWLLGEANQGLLVLCLRFPLRIMGVVFVVVKLSPGAWSRALNEGCLVMKDPVKLQPPLLHYGINVAGLGNAHE